MKTAEQIHHLLRTRRCLVVDGGLATELEAHDYNLSHPLWSGKLLVENPKAIKDVHLAYYDAGADIAITASYQASTRGLEEHLKLSDEAAKSLIRQSVTLAEQARADCITSCEDRHRDMLVAGSVGPYGAYLANGSEYHGDYDVDDSTLRAFHKPRIEALVEAGVDLLAIETVPSFAEVHVLLDLLREDFPTATAWISCTLRNAQHIADGTSVAKVAQLIETARPQIVAFGVNCVPPSMVHEFLLEAGQASNIPLLCYPNSGEHYNAESKTWAGSDVVSTNWSSLVPQWLADGAVIIGGCCRTGPSDIHMVAQLCSNRKQ